MKSIFKDLFGLWGKKERIPYPHRRILKRKGLAVVTCTELGFLGELGNQLFQVAAAIGYAKKNNYRVKLPYWYCKHSNSDYSKIFKSKIDQSLRAGHLFNVHRFKHHTLDYVDLPKLDVPLDLDGFFQSEKYFAHCRSDIKHAFQPNQNIERYILQKFGEILKEEKKVAVQIRTGKREKNDFDGHEYASKAFLEKAFSYYPHDFLFVIFADNMQRAKEILPADKRYFFVEGEKNYIDLFLMNKFSNYIISPSTFGWWGAWLSETDHPKVVVMEQWFKPNGIKAHLNNNSIIPEGWIKV